MQPSSIAIITLFARLDSIGIAGFSHDFMCLNSTYPPVERAFDQIGASQTGQSRSPFSSLTGFLAPFLPIILKFTLRKDSPIVLLRKSLEKVADDLWKKSRSEKGEETDNSIIGLLGRCYSYVEIAISPMVPVKADSGDKDLYMTKTEIVAQVRAGC